MLRNKIRILILLMITAISMIFGEPLTVSAGNSTTQTKNSTEKKVNNSTKKKSSKKNSTKKASSKTAKKAGTKKSKKATKKKTSSKVKKNTKKKTTAKAKSSKKNKATGKKVKAVKAATKTAAKTAAKATPKYSQSDLRLLSALIFCEAGGDYYGCYAGKKAVGIVVMNRVQSGSFPNDIYSVIYQRGQFGCTGSFLNSALSKYDSNTLGTKCIDAAKEALSGSKTVNYNGRTYDMTGYMFFSGYVPGAKLQIEGHQFK